MHPNHDYLVCDPEEALTALERIHVATVNSDTRNDMLVRILDEILGIFDCDRAWLICTSQIDTRPVRIFLERAKAGRAGRLATGTR